MFDKQNKIIIVDNVASQLELLGKSFLKTGLGCRTFEYSLEYEEPLKRVRIAFFDINLTEKSVDVTSDSLEQILQRNTTIFNDLGNAINQYIAKDNGPYILIFWTANTKVIDAFKLYMQNPDRGFADTASPLLITCIDKHEFQGEAESELPNKILELLNSDVRIKFLFDFEENAKNAGEKTLNRLYDILPKDEKWGDSTKLFENLDKILSKIASSTLGFSHAKRNPEKAVYEGLLPIVNYEFLRSTNQIDWDNITKQLVTAAKSSDLQSPDNNIQYKVNTLYHIEEDANPEKYKRGCVIEIDKTNQDTLRSLNINNFDIWFNGLIPIDDKTIKRAVRDNCQLIAIEFSSACDYSNDKARIHKYVLGVLIPDLDITQINKQRKPESSHHLGGCYFHLRDVNFTIWLNLNYVIGTTSEDARFGTSLFTLKKEIMDMLGNRYANHVSRIGITSF